jgi:hypothetical protein
MKSQTDVNIHSQCRHRQKNRFILPNRQQQPAPLSILYMAQACTVEAPSVAWGQSSCSGVRAPDNTPQLTLQLQQLYMMPLPRQQCTHGSAGLPAVQPRICTVLRGTNRAHSTRPELPAYVYMRSCRLRADKSKALEGFVQYSLNPRRPQAAEPATIPKRREP